MEETTEPDLTLGGYIMNEWSLADINHQIAASAESFIIDCEAGYDKMIRDVADKICRRANDNPITLIAGPSASGKTTTAHRIEQILDACGFETHTLSMDNYFADGTRNINIVDQNGNPDYESPLRLDMDLLNTQLQQLARGERVELPRFDFTAQKQCRSGKIIQRKKGELILMEGIHALNPDVTAGVKDCANKIYLSVRTRITDGTQRLHPSLIRFARRLLRDSRCRGRSPEESAKMLSSVSRGENLYIMPYKHLADFELDTFLPYELAFYRPFLMDILKPLAEAAPADSGIPLLYDFMQRLSNAEDHDWIPDISVIREFIGGSAITEE